MGDHARGDCKKAICSSEEEEHQQEVYRNSLHFNPASVAMLSRLNLREKMIPVPGTSGEAPALPAPPTADDTDRQFWAEDEMSSSDSRLHLVCRQRRRHSLAYRNRLAIRKRSRSLLCQSSSSNSDPAVNMNIRSPIRCNVHQRRQRCNNGQGPSTAKKSREDFGNVSGFRTAVSRTANPSTVNGSPTPGIYQPNSRRQMRGQCTPPPPAKQRLRRRSQTPISTSTYNTTTSINQFPTGNEKHRASRRPSNPKRN